MKLLAVSCGVWSHHCAEAKPAFTLRRGSPRYPYQGVAEGGHRASLQQAAAYSGEGK